jgi:hypothetical protein
MSYLAGGQFVKNNLINDVIEETYNKSQQASKKQIEHFSKDAPFEATIDTINLGSKAQMSVLGDMYVGANGDNWVRFVKPNTKGWGPGFGANNIFGAESVMTGGSFKFENGQQYTAADFKRVFGK